MGRVYVVPRPCPGRIGHCTELSGPLCQIATKGLGHEKPTLLITNLMEEKPATLVERYVWLMLVENTIEEAINFFHMGVLSSTVSLRVDLDL